MSTRVPASPSWQSAQQRMTKAREELVATDRAGSTPGVDADEARAAPSRLAQAGWSAGARVWGDRAVVSSPAGWAPRLTPKERLSPTDLQNLENQALRVLVALTPPGETSIPPAALENLPAHVEAYWAETFGKHRALLPEQRDALVAFIRAALEP